MTGDQVLSPATLVLGGARSGKSAWAERLADSTAGLPVYLAPAEAGDAEMAERIRRHRERRGPRWRTIEEPLEICAALRRECRPGQVVLVDCLSLWLSNLMGAGRDVEQEVARLLTALGALDTPVVLVSNEVGMGIVPANALARDFRDDLGRLNQAVARVAELVVFVAAGLPLALKAPEGWHLPRL
jgi:adenosylcobinamide kinase/adenosylcobinamide-phosphate guanylyltransferase